MRSELKICLLSAVGLALTSIPGLAADIPVKGPIAPAVPVFTWTGFYVGANAGYGWGRLGADTGVTGNAIIPDATLSLGSDVKGFFGGAQLGYNWQTGSYVFGIEGDYQFGDEKTSSSLVCAVGCLVTADNKLSSFATIRGRLGYAAFDRAMVYVTGGWARLSAKGTVTLAAAGVSATLLDTSTNKNGWTIGVGYEQMLWDHWSWKLEYLYMKASDTAVSVAIPAVLGGGTATETASITNNVIRAGVNYHF